MLRVLERSPTTGYVKWGFMRKTHVLFDACLYPGLK